MQACGKPIVAGNPVYLQVVDLKVCGVSIDVAFETFGRGDEMPPDSASLCRQLSDKGLDSAYFSL